MKLRNKKTGEIVEVESLYLTQSQELELTFTDEKNERKLYITGKISTFENEWEDYEEPKEHWFIDIRYPKVEPKKDINLSNSMRKRLKEIGNHFETKEEAEKAIEKLKAVKRLKDKGFRVNGWTILEEPKTSHIKLVIEAEMDVPDSPYDLDLLFGGGE